VRNARALARMMPMPHYGGSAAMWASATRMRAAACPL